MGKLAKAAELFANKTMGQIERSAGTIGKQADFLHKEIHTQLRPPIQPTMQAETRAFWERQDPVKRMQGLRRAVKDGDRETVSAVLQGPAYLSGMSNADRGNLETYAAEILTPDLHKNYCGAVDALTKVSLAANVFRERTAKKVAAWKTSDDDGKVAKAFADGV